MAEYDQAVVRTGGKQYRVVPGGRVRVEKLEGAVGDAIELAEVLLVGTGGAAQIGTPTIGGAKVRATVTAQGRGPKLTVYKFRRRKNYRKKQGHRQAFTELRIDTITA